jgi:YD repeat-containing protein
LTSATQVETGFSKELTYHPDFSRVTSLTDPNGNTTEFIYDTNGNLIETIDALQNSYFTVFNSRGQITSLTDALGNVTTFDYDPLTFNLILITDPELSTRGLAHDSAGNLEFSTDGESDQTQYAYDEMNRVIERIDALSEITQFSYDENGNLVEVMDKRGNSSFFVYDSRDRVIETIDPLMRSSTVGYDGNGNITNTLDRKSQLITFQYDSLNRLTDKDLPDGNQFDFTYDDEGNLLTASNNDSLLEFAYDELGRLTSERQVNNLIVGADSTVTRTYDGKGNRLTMTSDIGLTQYTYDDLDRLTSITAPDSSVIGFEYDDIGRRTEMSMPNGVVTTYAYDLASRYLSITHENVGGTFSSYGYTYDGNGNRTNVTVNRPGLPVNPTLDFSYDDIQQLVSATHIISGNPIETFLYDQLGNRIRRDGELEDAIYDANNAIEQNEGFLFVHDDNGNLVEQEDRNSGEVKRFEWDPEDRLTQITFHPSSVSPPNSTVLYAYDTDRRLMNHF